MDVTECKPMTQEEYMSLVGKPSQCPYCRGLDVVDGKPVVEALDGYTIDICKTCSKAWRTLYHAVGWFHGEVRFEPTGWKDY